MEVILILLLVIGLVVGLCVLLSRLAEHGIHVGDLHARFGEILDAASADGINEYHRQRAERAKQLSAAQQAAELAARSDTNPPQIEEPAPPTSEDTESIMPGGHEVLPSVHGTLANRLVEDAWIDPSRATRRYNRQVSKALVELAQQQDTATGLVAAVTRYEAQQVSLYETRERARLIPHKIDAEICELRNRQSRAVHDAEVASKLLSEQELIRQQQAQRKLELAEEDHRVALLKRQVQIRQLEVKLEQLSPPPQRKPEPAPKPSAPPPPPKDPTPEALRRHLASEEDLRRNRAEAARRINAIRDRAQAQDRDLSVDEQDEIDSIEDALVRAEEDIRRGGAADL